MTKRATVDMGTVKSIRVEVIGVEWDGYLVREIGTNRCDWFQKSRVTIH